MVGQTILDVAKSPKYPDGLSKLSPPLCQKEISTGSLFGVRVNIRLMNRLIQELFKKLFYFRVIDSEGFNALVEKTVAFLLLRCQSTMMQILQFVQVKRLERFESVISPGLR